jgi:hypothetical protein
MESNIRHILTDQSPSSGYRHGALAYTAMVPWTVPDGAAHVPYRGYLGVISPQLVSERLVSIEQRRLDQVRAVNHEAD